jgi:hypothetical protein
MMKSPCLTFSKCHICIFVCNYFLMPLFPYSESLCQTIDKNFILALVICLLSLDLNSVFTAKEFQMKGHFCIKFSSCVFSFVFEKVYL